LLFQATHFFDDCVELHIFRGKNAIGHHDALSDAIGRHLHDPQTIDAAHLPVVLNRRSGHAAELRVKLVVRLIGDLSRVIGLQRDGNAFLRLDGLMQSVVPLAIGHRPAGAFVDDDDLLLMNHVMLIEAKAMVRLDRAFDMFV
jgi:hypothetical protein